MRCLVRGVSGLPDHTGARADKLQVSSAEPRCTEIFHCDADWMNEARNAFRPEILPQQTALILASDLLERFHYLSDPGKFAPFPSADPIGRGAYVPGR